jgi:hypothetical protein
MLCYPVLSRNMPFPFNASITEPVVEASTIH